MEFTGCIRIRYSHDKLCTNHLDLWTEGDCLKHNVIDDLFIFTDYSFSLYSWYFSGSPE